MNSEAMDRLLGYHRRRYWLANGWCVRFRVKRCPVTQSRPHGIRYAFTLHDVDMTRLLGFDNAHGVPRRLAYDHRHRLRQTAPVAHDFTSADDLIRDFFDAVEHACHREDVPFAFVDEMTELEHEADYDDDIAA